MRLLFMIVVFDLDDTIYPEFEFVKSGFCAVAEFIAFGDHKYKNELYNSMFAYYANNSKLVFNRLITDYKLKFDVSKLIDIYRFHRPSISLSSEMKIVLNNCKKYAEKIGLITDGHYVTQSNKYYSLGLQQYIDFPIFTDMLNTSKPDETPFLYAMDLFNHEQNFCYVADNPKKDFLSPNKLDWHTIRLKESYGIYRDVENNAKEEATNLEDLNKKLIKWLCCE